MYADWAQQLMNEWNLLSIFGQVCLRKITKVMGAVNQLVVLLHDQDCNLESASQTDISIVSKLVVTRLLFAWQNDFRAHPDFSLADAYLNYKLVMHILCIDFLPLAV